jgi:hypothetical protein
MTYSTAAVADVTAFRGREFVPGDFRRAVFGTFFIGVWSIAAIGATIACVTIGAAWTISGLHSDNADFQVRRPFTLGDTTLAKLETAAWEKTYRGMADAAEATTAVSSLIPPAPVKAVKLLVFHAPPSMQLADADDSAPIAVPNSAPANSAPTSSTPLPPRRPLAARLMQAARAMVHASPAPATADVTASIAPQPAPSSGGVLQRLFAPHAAHNDTALLASVDSHTAIYDIEAHVVYLPNGDRMEAHSGLGQWIDDPQHVNIKDRGATPPNVYNLVMRDGLFHGVEAIRLTPVGDNSMYGRDGILAHPYMLGPSGQSFGCVSFKDYEAFLRAFKHGDVDRLVVVPHLDKAPATVRASRDSHSLFAFN